VTSDGILRLRVAAAAEVLWRGKGEASEDTTRIAEMRERLIFRGIQAGMIQMECYLKNKGGTLLRRARIIERSISRLYIPCTSLTFPD